MRTKTLRNWLALAGLALAGCKGDKISAPTPPPEPSPSSTVAGVKF